MFRLARAVEFSADEILDHISEVAIYSSSHVVHSSSITDKLNQDDGGINVHFERKNHTVDTDKIFLLPVIITTLSFQHYDNASITFPARPKRM